MSGHTPGPWTADGNGIHAGTQCVATTHMQPRERRIADARLIAALPELLEALRQCAAELGSIHHAGADMEHARAHSAGFRMALDALAQAGADLPEGYSETGR